MAVRDQDLGYDALVKRIFITGSPKISVGIHEADGAVEHDGLTVVALAAIHEFGLGVPERSFIRAWFDENQDRAKEALRRLLVSVIEGKRQPDQAVELFAQWAVGELQARIARGIAPGLAESTIAAKGSSVPLIDTGQLRSSISYEILDAHGAVKKRGQSNAAVERHQKALAEKRAAKKQERAEARGRARERRAIRKQVAADMKAGVKGAEKAVSQTVKDAQKGAKRLEKNVSKLAKKADKAVSRAAKDASKQASRFEKKADRAISRAAKGVKRSTSRLARKVRKAIR